jgi:hypothetical protein
MALYSRQGSSRLGAGAAASPDNASGQAPAAGSAPSGAVPLSSLTAGATGRPTSARPGTSAGRPGAWVGARRTPRGASTRPTTATPATPAPTTPRPRTPRSTATTRPRRRRSRCPRPRPRTRRPSPWCPGPGAGASRPGTPGAGSCVRPPRRRSARPTPAAPVMNLAAPKPATRAASAPTNPAADVRSDLNQRKPFRPALLRPYVDARPDPAQTLVGHAPTTSGKSPWSLGHGTEPHAAAPVQLISSPDVGGLPAGPEANPGALAHGEGGRQMGR